MKMEVMMEPMMVLKEEDSKEQTRLKDEEGMATTVKMMMAPEVTSSYVLKREHLESEAGSNDDGDDDDAIGIARPPGSGSSSSIDKEKCYKKRKRLYKMQPVTCRTCGKRFAQNYIKTHMLIHSGEKPYQCPVCPVAVRQHTHLKDHMIRYHPGEPIPSSEHKLIGKAAPSPPVGIIQSVRKGGMTTAYKCPTCRAAFRQYSRLLIHIRKFHPGAPPPSYKNRGITAPMLPEAEADDDHKTWNKLSDCKVQLSRWDLEDNNPMSSSLILQKFNSMVAGTEGQNLSLQVESDDGRKCVVNVDINLLAHFLQPMYPPPPASGLPRVGDYLQSWPSPSSPPSSSQSPVIRKKSGPKSKTSVVKAKPEMKNSNYLDRKLECKKCNKRFKHRRSLHLHQLANHSTKNNVGNKKSRKQVNRSGMMMEDKPGRDGRFRCSVCERKFRRMDILKKHMELHSGKSKTDTECPICFKCFKTSNYLMIHIRSHTGERPYGCKICGKRFSQTSVLNMHMRLHTGEKPYPCPKCGQRFAQSSSMDSHMRTTHSGEVDCYRCRLCGATFSDIRSLNQHSASH